MPIRTCVNCGGVDLYQTAKAVSILPLRMLGPGALPGLPRGRFRAVVCKSCGLTSFFAPRVDLGALEGPGWERVSAETRGPLGLADL